MLKTANLGTPRIGDHRELKKATESYWKGEISKEALESQAREIRKKNWLTQKEAGIDIKKMRTLEEENRRSPGHGLHGRARHQGARQQVRGNNRRPRDTEGKIADAKVHGGARLRKGACDLRR